MEKTEVRRPRRSGTPRRSPRPKMSMQLPSKDGRVVLLTGAAGGIGSAITEALLADGHSVAAADRNEAALTRLAAIHALTGASARLEPILADLADARACAHAVEAALAR